MNSAKYAATERLRNGASLQIRALLPSDDPHQKLGIATHLISHLIEIARAAGLEEFVAEVLPENVPMLKVFERCGLAMTTRSERGVVHVTLALSPGAEI